MLSMFSLWVHATLPHIYWMQCRPSIFNVAHTFFHPFHGSHSLVAMIFFCNIYCNFMFLVGLTYRTLLHVVNLNRLFTPMSFLVLQFTVNIF